MNTITARQLELLGEVGYFQARTIPEIKSARQLARLMQLVEREDIGGNDKVFYTFRLRQAAVEQVAAVYYAQEVAT